MSRSRLITPLKRETSYSSLSTNTTTQPKKIPIDPNSNKFVKQARTNVMTNNTNNKSPLKRVLKGAQANMNGIQLNTSKNDSITMQPNKSFGATTTTSSSRVTNVSTQGSYSSFTNDITSNTTNGILKQQKERHHNIRMSSDKPINSHSRQLSNQNINNKSTISNKKSTQPNVTNKSKTMESSSNSNFNDAISNKENVSNNQPITLKEKVLQEKTAQILIVKNQQEVKQSFKGSFKDSFVDSDNFLNINEKYSEEVTTTDCSNRNFRQKSLNQLIKEKFLGPIMALHGNSSSLLKRNVLNTNSNLSNRSSTCSMKSSFIPINNKLVKSSFQSNNGPMDTENIDDCTDELTNNAKHCCDKINQYSMIPRTFFGEVVNEVHTRQSKLNKQQQNLNDFITSVPQVHIYNDNCSAYTSSKNQSFNNMSEVQDQSQRSSIRESKLTPQKNEQQDEAQQQEDIIEFLQSDTHKMHLIQTLQSLQYVKNFLQPPKVEQIKSKKVTLPPFRKPWINKTIVFDLDETLVHCIEDIYNNKVDKLINVSFPNGEIATAGINIRPYALDCLKRAAELYQVVVFTASHQSYADVVLDLLDPHNEIFEKRLYRDSCVKSNDGVYVKDLRIFEPTRKLEDIVIVDNAVYSFGYQLENGIPIIPFYDDKEDEELLHLMQYLECLVKNGGDVREHNRKAFQLRELQELDVQQFLSNMLYDGQLNAKSNKIVSNNKQRQSYDMHNVECSSVINEEPNEDDESSFQESRRQDDDQQNDHQRVVTNTSILERDSYE